MLLQFENPGAFWGLLGVALLMLLMIRNRMRAPASFAWRRFAVSSFAFLFCVFALARPQLGHQVTHKRGMRGNLFIALDISRSMVAADIIPSRIGFAIAFATKVLHGLSGLRVAIFPFALDGYMMIPLTSDLNMAADMLGTLTPSMTTNQGTDITGSLEQLFQQIGKMELAARERGEDWAPSQVLLISDGESHFPVKSGTLSYYRTSHIPIFTVTVGTQTGATLPVESRFSRHDNAGDGFREPSGRSVVTKASPETMAKISHETAGDWFPAQLDQAPRAASKIMQSMQLGKLTSSFKVDKEYYPFLLMLAMIAFSLELAFGRWDYAIRSLLLPLALCLALGAGRASAEEGVPPPPAAAPTPVTDPEARAVDAYNEGLKLLTGREANKAAELFQEAAVGAKDNKELKKKALFNLGNTLMRMMDPGQAVQAYQAAHDVVTSDKKFNKESNQRISENLLLAVEMEEKMKQMAQQQQQNQQGKSGEEPQQAADQKGPQKDYQPQYFNDTQKQRMYDLMASEEQQIMQRLMQEKSKKPQTRTTDKPW